MLEHRPCHISVIIFNSCNSIETLPAAPGHSPHWLARQWGQGAELQPACVCVCISVSVCQCVCDCVCVCVSSGGLLIGWVSSVCSLGARVLLLICISATGPAPTGQWEWATLETSIGGPGSSNKPTTLSQCGRKSIRSHQLIRAG